MTRQIVIILSDGTQIVVPSERIIQSNLSSVQRNDGKIVATVTLTIAEIDSIHEVENGSQENTNN